ncbi:MAG: hypothetical protein Q9M48_07280 [Rhodobacterales bacterium]|nr:hypothetical protein [Rhodobacterales bacterium]
MTAPIVIHAGFHKTATSTIQQFLQRNRPALNPHLALGLKWKMKEILHAARVFSTWRDPVTLMKFARRFDAFVAAHSGVQRRGLFISAEELCGHMPGRGDLLDYSAAPILMAEIRDAFTRAHSAPDLHFAFTIRPCESWLKSAYWEHVKSASMTLDYADFHAKYAPAADLPACIQAIKTAVAPFPVHTFDIKDQHRLGPIAPMLDLFDLPSETRQALVPIPAKNQRQSDDILNELLEINRNIDDREVRKTAKQAVLNAARKKP